VKTASSSLAGPTKTWKLGSCQSRSSRYCHDCSTVDQPGYTLLRAVVCSAAAPQGDQPGYTLLRAVVCSAAAPQGNVCCCPLLHIQQATAKATSCCGQLLVQYAVFVCVYCLP
jgi:hypothetical protein